MSYHFRNLWPSTQRWLKGKRPKVARSITYWPFFEKLFCSRNFLFPTFGRLIYLLKSHYFKELLSILEKNCGNGPRSGFSEIFFWNNQKMTKGKMVLKMLIYAKSAIYFFRPIRGLHSGHGTWNCEKISVYPSY